MLRYETTAMLINASMLIVDVYLKKILLSNVNVDVI